MAPKTRGSCIGAAGIKRKRSEKKPVREPTPVADSSSSSSTPAASPAHVTQEVDHLASRVITTGRKVNFELFENEGFHFGRQLIEMGLEKICSLDCPTYPALVKEFYRNLSRGDDGLVSMVRGIGLNITAPILSRLLELPLSGPSTFTPEDRSPALSRLLNRDVDGLEDIYANQLPLELRLLHNICSRILFPKTGRFDYVSERDIFIMDAIVSGKPFNLPRMIIWYIADCGSKKKSSLPYGMILTQLFRRQGVVISDSEPKRELRHTDYYSLATIHRMGFIKSDGRWERKGQNEERATDAPGPSVSLPIPEPSISPDQTPVPAPAPSVPVHSASASTSTSIGFNEIQLAQLKTLLDSQKNDLKEELSKEIEDKFMMIRQELYSLDERVNKMESTLGTSCDFLKIDLKNIFEELKDIGGDSETYSKCNAELQEKITTACAFVDEKLKSYVKVQCEGMQNIIEHLNRITRRNF